MLSIDIQEEGDIAEDSNLKVYILEFQILHFYIFRPDCIMVLKCMFYDILKGNDSNFIIGE